jgi:uncharacterized protein (DUF1697 family)
MPRFVALLRGVGPLNVKMPDLKRCFEASGLTSVQTILSSGNVVFKALDSTESALEIQVEQAMQQGLGKACYYFYEKAAEPESTVAAGARPSIRYLHPWARSIHRLRWYREGSRIHEAHRTSFRKRGDDANLGDYR